MARALLSLGLQTWIFNTVLSTAILTQGHDTSTPTTEEAESVTLDLSLLSIINSTGLVYTSWDPRVKCFSNPPWPALIPYEPIDYADYLQALAKIGDMPDVNIKREWPPGKSMAWEYNKAAIWVRASFAGPASEDTRFAPSFVALCARSIAARCLTTTEKLGGSAMFGPDRRFTVMIDALGELGEGGIGTTRRMR